MQTYVVRCGEMINETAKQMLALANRTGDTIVAKFNDIELKANPSEDVEVGAAVITAYYNSESSRRAEAYRNSPEGQRVARQAKECQQKFQGQANEAMFGLSSLDFTDLNAVLKWIEKIREPSDHIGVKVPHERIVTTFRQHGYKPSVNTGRDFNEDDEENFARYIIGQALEHLSGVSFGGMKIHAIHQVIEKFIEDWRKKFGHI